MTVSQADSAGQTNRRNPPGANPMNTAEAGLAAQTEAKRPVAKKIDHQRRNQREGQ